MQICAIMDMAGREMRLWVDSGEMWHHSKEMPTTYNQTIVKARDASRKWKD